MINIQRADSIYEAIYRIGQRAQAEQADVVVIANDDRALSYAFDAVCYGQYITYNIIYDRRTWNYHELQHVRPHHCVFVTSSTESIKMEIIDIRDQSVVDYIEKQYGVFRNPNSSRGNKKKVVFRNPLYGLCGPMRICLSRMASSRLS